MNTLIAAIVAGIAGLSLTSSVISGIISLAATALLLAAKYKIFEKMGEKGWKGLIPVYSEYIIFKHVWNTKMFGAFFGCLGAYTLACVIAAVLSEGLAANIIALLAAASILGACVIAVVLMYKLCKAFGHGVGYTIGGLISEPIMLAVLGFGKSEYVGA